MILEIATFEITPGQEAAFEAGVGKARALFARAKGCHAMSLRKVIERPSTDRLQDIVIDAAEAAKNNGSQICSILV